MASKKVDFEKYLFLYFLHKERLSREMNEDKLSPEDVKKKDTKVLHPLSAQHLDKKIIKIISSISKEMEVYLDRNKALKLRWKIKKDGNNKNPPDQKSIEDSLAFVKHYEEEFENSG